MAGLEPGRAGRAFLAAGAVSLAVWGGCAGPRSRDGAAATIVVDTLVRHQTMTGWEAVAQAGQGEPGFPRWQDRALDLAVTGLGINRLRLEVRSGTENPVDHYAELARRHPEAWRSQRYATVNDNGDPDVIAWNGFHFTEMDEAVEAVVLPMRRRLEAAGERLFLNLTYVSFVREAGGHVHSDPAEYAEFLLACFLHLRDRYQIVPDAVEVILEPDNTAVWRGEAIGRAIVAAGDRLAAAGFHPDFIGPSTTSMSSAVPYLEDMLRVPGVLTYLREFSYHRYRGVSSARLSAIDSVARRHRLRTAMLEHIGSGVEDLHDDLTTGSVSAWEQFALAWPSTEAEDGSYIRVRGASAELADRSRYLGQYFRHVRIGFTRVGASTSDPALRVTAFTGPTGAMVVVVQGGPRTLSITGLRPGTYTATITTADTTSMPLGAQTLLAGTTLRVTTPAEGVVTIASR